MLKNTRGKVTGKTTYITITITLKPNKYLPYTSPNACRKRNVLSLVLNRLCVFAFLMSAGKLFHSVGAAEEKARVPNVANILPLPEVIMTLSSYSK